MSGGCRTRLPRSEMVGGCNASEVLCFFSALPRGNHSFAVQEKAGTKARLSFRGSLLQGARSRFDFLAAPPTLSSRARWECQTTQKIVKRFKRHVGAGRKEEGKKYGNDEGRRGRKRPAWISYFLTGCVEWTTEGSLLGAAGDNQTPSPPPALLNLCDSEKTFGGRCETDFEANAFAGAARHRPERASGRPTGRPAGCWKRKENLQVGTPRWQKDEKRSAASQIVDGWELGKKAALRTGKRGGFLHRN